MNEPIVDVLDLSVTFGERTVLRDVTLSIPSGSVLAVLGPNGSGKTTFVRALLGLIQPSSGMVRIFGVAPRAVPAEWIGYVPQIKTFDRSFPGTALELVVSGIRRRWPWRITAGERERALGALDAVGAARLAGRGIAQLSGGELQRLYLARAMVRNARLVLLDEPGAGVDVAGEATLHAFVDKHRRSGDMTFVIVTHDLNVAAHHATHILLVNQRQVAFGPPAAVLVDDLLSTAFGHVTHPLVSEPAVPTVGTARNDV